MLLRVIKSYKTQKISKNKFSIFPRTFREKSPYRLGAKLLVYNTKQNYVCLFVCLQQRITLTAGPIGFSFTGQLFIVPGKVCNYFLGGWDTPNPPKNEKYPPPKKKILFKTKIKIVGSTTPQRKIFFQVYFLNLNYEKLV